MFRSFCFPTFHLFFFFFLRFLTFFLQCTVSVFILNPDSILNIRSCLSVPLPPPNPQLLSVSPSLEREGKSLQKCSVSNRELNYRDRQTDRRTDGHIEDCQSAEIKADREEKTGKSATDRFPEQKKK